MRQKIGAGVEQLFRVGEIIKYTSRGILGDVPRLSSTRILTMSTRCAATSATIVRASSTVFGVNTGPATYTRARCRAGVFCSWRAAMTSAGSPPNEYTVVTPYAA
jgi:hypothetical protein